MIMNEWDYNRIKIREKNDKIKRLTDKLNLKKNIIKWVILLGEAWAVQLGVQFWWYEKKEFCRF